MVESQAGGAELERRVRESFDRQQAMALLGARLERVAPGEVEIALRVRPELTQQHGFVHAGVLAAIADSACGYAALTLMPEGAAVLSIEFKINLLAPALGQSLRARARVRKPGRNVSVCECDILAVDAGQEKLVSILTASMMTVRDRPELHG